MLYAESIMRKKFLRTAESIAKKNRQARKQQKIAKRQTEEIHSDGVERLRSRLSREIAKKYRLKNAESVATKQEIEKRLEKTLKQADQRVLDYEEERKPKPRLVYSSQVNSRPVHRRGNGWKSGRYATFVEEKSLSA